MLNKESLEKFTKTGQTSLENIVREYCQHLFLSYLYQQRGSEKLLFKGGTALRIILGSPRFSEDLDFTGINISYSEIETILTNTLVAIEQTGIKVEIVEGKETTGGYLGIINFLLYNLKIKMSLEISLRRTRKLKGTRALIVNNYVPSYTLAHLPLEDLIQGKIDALRYRHKPRDFYDFFFLLSGNYAAVKNTDHLKAVLALLRVQKINFRNELKKFLPASHSMHLRDFSRVLEQKILGYLWKKK